jgi:hypothetical protein
MSSDDVVDAVATAPAWRCASSDSSSSVTHNDSG